jgi:hypothetical protein
VTHLELPLVDGHVGEARADRLAPGRHDLTASAEPRAIALIALGAALRPRREIGIGWRAVRAIIRRQRRPKSIGPALARLRALVRRRPRVGVWLSGLGAGAAVFLWARRVWATARRL